jgi:hypothetical protein
MWRSGVLMQYWSSRHPEHCREPVGAFTTDHKVDMKFE